MRKEETIDYNIKVAWHAISRMYNQYGQPFDITAAIGFVLLNIDTEKGTPATKIAPLMGLEARSLTRLLKSMEEKKWIYREKDPKDGRSVRILLTPLGRTKREISRRSVREFNKRIYEAIPSEKISAFFEVIQIVLRVVDDREVFSSLAAELMPKMKPA